MVTYLNYSIKTNWLYWWKGVTVRHDVTVETPSPFPSFCSHHCSFGFPVCCSVLPLPIPVPPLCAPSPSLSLSLPCGMFQPLPIWPMVQPGNRTNLTSSCFIGSAVWLPSRNKHPRPGTRQTDRLPFTTAYPTWGRMNTMTVQASHGGVFNNNYDGCRCCKMACWLRYRDRIQLIRGVCSRLTCT